MNRRNRTRRPPHGRTGRLPALLLLCLAAAGGFAGTAADAAPLRGLDTLPASPLIFGYLNELRTTNHHLVDLAQLDYDAVDVIVHGFAEPRPDGSVGFGLGKLLRYREALLARAHARGRSVVLSVGGGAPERLRDAFATLAASPARRDKFASQLLRAVSAWGYDGIDIDYEFPSNPREKAHFTELMRVIHRQFKAESTNYLIQFGVSTGFYVDMYDWPALAGLADFAFYFGYNWKNPANGPLSNPGVAQWVSGGREKTEASARGAIDYMLTRGFPADKIIFGLPFYSSANDSWPVLRDIWSTNRAWFSNAIDAAALEVRFAGRWWTTPESVQRKLSAVLDPGQSVLTNRTVLRGAGFWEFGHQDVTRPDLTGAIKDWMSARTNTTPAITATNPPPAVPVAPTNSTPPAGPAPTPTPTP